MRLRLPVTGKLKTNYLTESTCHSFELTKMTIRSVLTQLSRHFEPFSKGCCKLTIVCILLLWSGVSYGKDAVADKVGGKESKARSEYLSLHGLTVYAEQATKWNDDVEKLAANNTRDSNPKAILFIGSSTIRLWNTLEQDVAPYLTIKRGYGGAKFCDLAIHSPDLVAGLKYRAAVVFIANDITGEKSDKEPEEIKRLASITIDTLKADNPQASVILLSITATPSRFAHWKRIQAANRALSTLADENNGVYFIETESHYLNQEGKPIDEYFVEDRLHQTPEGYRLLGGLVKAELDAIYATEPLR